MKKSLIFGILGLVAGVASSYGQGFIKLDNYNSNGGSGVGPEITFGVGSGGTVGAGLPAGWTVGIYFASGNIMGSLSSTAAGSGSVDPLFTLGSGSGSTAAIDTSAFGDPGYFIAGTSFNTGLAPGQITVELVAYLTSAGSYNNDTTVRGHSAAFLATTGTITANPQPLIGDFMSAFSVTAVPEPTTLALAGLGGLASLVAFRRKKA
jgi:hypothetical protein